MTQKQQTSFTPIAIPKQKVFYGVPFPLALSPAPAPAQVPSLAEAVRQNKPWVEAKLREAGALLFRGFKVPTATEFNDVLEALGYDNAPVNVSGAKRTHIVGRIFTSNDGPPEMKFYCHNEMAYINDHPKKAFFYCEVEPESGGETGIVLGHVLYRRMKEKHPEFVEHLERCGLVYTRGLADGTDPNSMIGRGWQSTFGTEDKSEAEKKASQLGWELKWLEDGGVQAKMAPVPGIKVVKSADGSERKLWFNSIAAAYLTWVDTRNKQGINVQFADGTPLPRDVMGDYLKILDEECVAFPWKHGDVLMLDNHAVMHSRNPFSGPRRVLAAFTM